MKKAKYITISLNEQDSQKAQELATQQARPLAQFLGLIISQHLNPTSPANIAENLKIFRDGQQVNEINTTGTPAALELAKVFIWCYNDPKSVSISGVIVDGVHEINAVYNFAGNGCIYKYVYHFSGQACENLPRV